MIVDTTFDFRTDTPPMRKGVPSGTRRSSAYRVRGKDGKQRWISYLRRVRGDRRLMRVAWVCLVIVSVGILGFGVITVLPAVAGGNLLIVANGLASIGLGLFGGLIVLIPFRRGERWAWSVLWFYPVFWVVHLVAELPPGKDHIHQIVFIVLSAAGLLLPVRDMIGAGRPPAPRTRSGT